jgi:hypothetical protein
VNSATSFKLAISRVTQLDDLRRFSCPRGGKYMDCDPNEITRKIAQYLDEIDEFKMQIQQRKRCIADLMVLSIFDDEGEEIPFANWKF